MKGQSVSCRLAWILVLMLGLGGSLSAWALDPVEMKIITGVVEGQGEVGLMLLANRGVKQAILEVAPEGGSTRRYSSGPIADGAEKLIAIPQKAGDKNYSGTLHVYFKDGGEGGMPISFRLTVMQSLQVEVDKNSLDLVSKKVSFTASRPVAKVEYRVLADTGVVMDQGSKAFSAAEAGGPLTLQWAGTEGTVIRIDMKVTDTTGTFSQLELSPWHVDIEHEEVVFRSGSDAIDASEQPKLDHAYGLIQENVRKYGKLVQLNLYIAGYTDTVGKAAHNQELSLRRARSIAKAFRAKGFSFPIYYQGFGEEVLAIPTEDETDEAKNRRALYILGGDTRPSGPQIPKDAWKQLP